jgi:hypothetical protein
MGSKESDHRHSSDPKSAPRLPRGYRFAATPSSVSVQAHLLQFKNLLWRGFVNSIELPKPAMNASAIFRQLFYVVPKPGVRGSSPLRDAISPTTFDVQTCTGKNLPATERRMRGV